MSKYLIALIFVVVVIGSLAGCGGTASDQPVSDDIKQDGGPKIPFNVKEPEKFSADVFVKTNANGKILTSKYFLARDGKNRIEKFGIGEENEFSILITERNEAYRIFYKKKQYEGLKDTMLPFSKDTLGKSLTSRWLNAEKPVSFEDLGEEGGYKKYQAKIEDSKNTEITIFIDNKLDYPVKQEVWLVKGDKREMVFSMELKNISTTPAPALFQVPAGFTIKPKSNKTENEIR